MSIFGSLLLLNENTIYGELFEVIIIAESCDPSDRSIPGTGDGLGNFWPGTLWLCQQFANLKMAIDSEFSH